MANKYPSIFRMTRASFFSALLAPLVYGMLLACYVDRSFALLNFLLVLIIGVGMEAATNVYNDIYDTKQGPDEANLHRNQFSGGSGILLQHPELMPKMYLLARTALAMALAGTAVLTFLIEPSLRIILWAMILVSALLSKYYTAAPIKLAYRGLGEIAVWFTFGPLATLLAWIAQNPRFHPVLVTCMPIGGLSTLSILLVGQMIDLPADRMSGKLGFAARFGGKAAAALYLAVQTAIVVNVAGLAFHLGQSGWPLLLSLVPYAVLLPRIARQLKAQHNDPARLVGMAKLNAQLHLVFSAILILGMLGAIVVRDSLGG